jgi:hypothetical protein
MHLASSPSSAVPQTSCAVPITSPVGRDRAILCGRGKRGTGPSARRRPLPDCANRGGFLHSESTCFGQEQLLDVHVLCASLRVVEGGDALHQLQTDSDGVPEVGQLERLDGRDELQVTWIHSTRHWWRWSWAPLACRKRNTPSLLKEVHRQQAEPVAAVLVSWLEEVSCSDLQKTKPESRSKFLPARPCCEWRLVHTP